VLAGGRSTRFGSDKLAANYRGRPLLLLAVEHLSAVCEETVVVLAPDAQAPELPDGVRIARDEVAYQGPLAGLLAGLAAARTEWAMVVAGDMPELAEPVLREMLRVVRGGEVDEVILRDGDQSRPLPAALRVARASVVAHGLFDAGERRLRAVADALDAGIVDEPVWTALDPERRTLVDVDDPDDLPTG
jgi:molybdopterin-guanine dinucleotide biosynthesis protein A